MSNLFSQTPGSNLFSIPSTSSLSLKTEPTVVTSPQNNENSAVYDCIIIGSGPAGYTAAIYLERAGFTTLMLAGELSPGGQLETTTTIENFPGFPDGIDGPQLMQNMKQQALKFGLTVYNKEVVSTDLSSNPKTVTTADNSIYSTRSVVVATGSSYRKLGIPGETEYSAHGVSYCATCDGFFFTGKPIVVIGGGDSALTEALYLTRFGSTVTIIHRRDTFRASQILVNRALSNPKISTIMNSTVEEIAGDGTNATSVIVKNKDANETTSVDAEGIFIAIGDTPNSGFLNNQLNLDNQGYVLVDGASTKTSVPGVFAAGDVVDSVYRQAISAAGMGCRAALDAQDWLTDNR